MIAKYPGTCRYCRKPIQVGRDEYDLDKKTSYHIECHENQPPSPEQFRLADQLGFVSSDIAVGVCWSELPTRREVLLLLDGDRSDSAGRASGEAYGGQSALFGVRTGEEGA